MYTGEIDNVTYKDAIGLENLYFKVALNNNNNNNLQTELIYLNNRISSRVLLFPKWNLFKIGNFQNLVLSFNKQTTLYIPCTYSL